MTKLGANAVTHDRRWEILAAFVFGCVFLTVILIVAFFKPDPTPFEYTVYRIIIALAAAGVGAILPGFLDVRFKNWLRAGGALALFVIVYFFPPVAIATSDASLGPGPSADAKIRADAWLLLVDRNDYNGAYNSMADAFRARYPLTQFEQLIARERRSLGPVKARQFISTAPFESPPGAPRGVYRQYGYKTSFENESEAIYELVWLVGENQNWRVSGFYTMVKTQAGQFVPYEPK